MSASGGAQTCLEGGSDEPRAKPAAAHALATTSQTRTHHCPWPGRAARDPQARCAALATLSGVLDLLPSEVRRGQVMPILRNHMQPLDLDPVMQRCLAKVFGQLVTAVRGGGACRRAVGEGRVVTVGCRCAAEGKSQRHGCGAVDEGVRARWGRRCESMALGHGTQPLIWGNGDRPIPAGLDP
jgi:hypothetical protein